MKVHLCCGDVYLDGYLNIDACGTLASGVVNKTTVDKYYAGEMFKPKHLVIDRQMKLPDEWDYQPDSLDEVLLICAIEHFSKDDVVELIKNIYISLKIGGDFRFDFPDVLETVDKYKDNPDLMMRLIYGSGKNEFAYHKHGYTKETISAVLNEHPWSSIEFKEIVKHDYPMIGVIATK